MPKNKILKLIEKLHKHEKGKENFLLNNSYFLDVKEIIISDWFLWSTEKQYKLYKAI